MSAPKKPVETMAGYHSDRVFDGVSTVTGEPVVRLRARVKAALDRREAKEATTRAANKQAAE